MVLLYAAGFIALRCTNWATFFGSTTVLMWCWRWHSCRKWRCGGACARCLGHALLQSKERFLKDRVCFYTGSAIIAAHGIEYGVRMSQGDDAQ